MYRFLTVIVVLFLFACKEVSFKEPQPKGTKRLSEIPRELRGTYLVIEEKGNNRDTLRVSAQGYFIPSDSSKGTLGDSLVLKKYKGYYFFNDHENPEWLLRVLKRETNGDLSYMLMDPGAMTFDEFLLTLNKEIKIDSIDVDGEKLYQIDPAAKELISLIEKGYFKKTITLKKHK